MLYHRLRRRPNTKTTLCHFWAFNILSTLQLGLDCSTRQVTLFVGMGVINNSNLAALCNAHDICHVIVMYIILYYICTVLARHWTVVGGLGIKNAIFIVQPCFYSKYSVFHVFSNCCDGRRIRVLDAAT